MRKPKAFLIISFLLILYLSVFGTNYYISQEDGNDGYNGLYPTFQGGSDGPWLTVNKVNISSFNVGDNIDFKRGGVWREQLTVPSSGSSGSPITFGAYGTGNNPFILASTDADIVGSWSRYDSLNVLLASYFETGDLTEWDQGALGTGGTITAHADAIHIGSYGAKFVIDASLGAHKYLQSNNSFSDQTEIYCRYYIKFNSWTGVTDDDVEVLRLPDDATNNYCYLQLYYSGTNYYLYLAVRSDGGTWNYIPGSGASGWLCDSIMDQAWHSIKVHFKAGSGADGIGEFWVDGTSRGSKTDGDYDTRRVGNILLGFISMASGTTGTVYVDDVIVSSSDIIGPIWKTANSSYTADPNSVFYDTNTTPTRCIEEATYAGLSANWEWWYDAANDFVAVYQDVNNPATVANGLEIPVRDFCIYPKQSYITIDGIDQRFGRSNNIGLYAADTGKTDVILRNFTSSYTAGTGSLIMFSRDDWSNVTIDNCVGHHSGGAGFDLSKINAYTVSDCIIYSCSNVGLGIYGSATYKITNGLIKGNTIYGITNEDGIALHKDGGGNGIGINHTIQNNHVYNVQENCLDIVTDTASANILVQDNDFYGSSEACIWISSDNGDLSDVTFKRNKLHDSNYNLIQIGYATDIKFYCNQFYNATFYMLSIGDSGSGSAAIFYNNTFHQDGNQTRNFLYICSNTTSIIARNNIICDAGTSYTLVSYGAGATPANTGTDFDYNQYHRADNDPTQLLWNGRTFANWKAIDGQDTTIGQFGDPKFQDAANNNFRLNPHSPCVNKGADVGLINDYEGKSVRHAPDIGAFEDQTNVLFMGMQINPLIPVLLFLFAIIAYRRNKNGYF